MIKRLKNVTQNLINNCNALEVVYKEYLILDGVTIPIKAKLTDDCYENGNFIGTFIFKTLSFETDSQYNFKQKEFEYYKVVNGESIKIGTFITTELEINDTTELVKVVAMDYGLKTQIEYISQLDYESDEITLLDVWNEACQLSGLESGIEDFPNSDFIVDSDQFSETGATIRDVFKGIAMSSGNFVKVKNDDKIYLVFNDETDDLIEDYVELEDKRDTQPWTCIRLGMSQIDGENVDYIDPELVAEYGEHWLILNDNPFAYTQEKRQQLIMDIFNQIKGFGYSAFSSKTAFKPYLTCGDLVKFKNRNGEIINSILLRYEHNYEEITLSAPSETSATVNYVYPLNAIDITKRTEAKVDKYSGEIELLTEQTSNLQDSIKNVYTIEQTNQLIQTASTGVTNTFSEAGGNNIFRNTGLWFSSMSTEATLFPSNTLYPAEDLFCGNKVLYEYWNGVLAKAKEEKASNTIALLISNGECWQEQKVPNGNYTVSFKYKKLISLANVKVKINGVEYELTQENDTEFVESIVVKSNYINVLFESDIDESCEIYDLMVNAGTVKLAYSQNQNETTTDTVNISKGITITSSNTDTVFKANADGIRTLDKSENVLTEFTDEGMTTKKMIVEGQSQLVGLLVQEVGGQTWFTRL